MRVCVCVLANMIAENTVLFCISKRMNGQSKSDKLIKIKSDIIHFLDSIFVLFKILFLISGYKTKISTETKYGTLHCLNRVGIGSKILFI